MDLQSRPFTENGRDAKKHETQQSNEVISGKDTEK